MTRIGGFPRRINRPAAPPPATAVEAKQAAVEQPKPRSGFPQRPTRPVASEPAVKYDHDAADMDDPDSAGSGDPFTESLDYRDADDAPVITVPVQPLPRPQLTIMHPTEASRMAPPPMRKPGSGLLSSSVGAPAGAQAKAPPPLPPPQARGVPRPASFQPPARKVEAKPAAPAAKALPRVSMHDAVKRPVFARKVDPSPPTKVHRGYMGRMDLIDPEEIPF
jgi:hypothetical protein